MLERASCDRITGQRATVLEYWQFRLSLLFRDCKQFFEQFIADGYHTSAPIFCDLATNSNRALMEVDIAWCERIAARLEGGAPLFPEGFIFYQDGARETPVTSEAGPSDEK